MDAVSSLASQSSPSTVSLERHDPLPEGREHETTVLVRFFAAARAAAGADEEVLQLPSGTSVAEAVDALRERHPGELARVLSASSFLLDGIAVRDVSRPLSDGSELDVLPPFAGG